MLASDPTAGPIVLDGGLSTALEQQGADLGGALWTARLLGEEPERISRAHRDYFRAGARVATTASYQASIEGLVAAGYDATEARRLITSSVTLAREVRDEMGDTHPGLLVAASVGPYGAFLADGSEYRGRYGVSPARLREFHAPRLELLAAAGPDLLAVETIPDSDEAEVLVALLDGLGVPAWFSYSVRGATTNAGQPLADAYAVLAGSRSVFAAGVNCSEQADVLCAVRAAVAATGLPAVAYPNRGGSWDSDTKAWAYGEPLDLDLLGDWVAAGVRYVGWVTPPESVCSARVQRSRRAMQRVWTVTWAAATVRRRARGRPTAAGRRPWGPPRRPRPASRPSPGRASRTGARARRRRGTRSGSGRRAGAGHRGCWR